MRSGNGRKRQCEEDGLSSCNIDAHANVFDIYEVDRGNMLIKMAVSPGPCPNQCAL